MSKFNIYRNELLKPLQVVTGIVERRHTLPILSNVLLRSKDKNLELIATDLEIQIATAEKTTESLPEMEMTISARKLQDILRSLPEKSSISIESNESKAVLRAGKSRFNLQTLPVKDFPLIKQQPKGSIEKITLQQGILKNMLQQVQYAMAQQDIRYYLNGLLLVCDEKNITLVATDGHRLCHISTEAAQKISNISVIVPRKTVLELVKLLSDDDTPVEIQITENQISTNFSGITLDSKLVDGNFPDYKRVIPTNLNNELEIEKEALQQALQRASILSNEKFRGVRWVLTKDKLKIVCNNTEQEEAEEELEVDYSGEPIDIGFNVNYLLDCLNNMSIEKVKCQLGDSNTSMLITVEKDSSFKYVVMPMRI